MGFSSGLAADAAVAEGGKAAGEAFAPEIFGAIGGADLGASAASLGINAAAGLGAAAPAIYGAADTAASASSLGINAAAGLGGTAPAIYGAGDTAASASSLGINASAGLGGTAPAIYGAGDTAASASSLGINSSAPSFGAGSGSGFGTGSGNSSLSDLSGAEAPVVSDSSTLPSSAGSTSASGAESASAETAESATGSASGSTAPATSPTDVSNAASQSAAEASASSAPTSPVSNDILDTSSAQGGTAYGSGTGAASAASNSSISSALKQLGAYGKDALAVGKDVAGIGLPVASLLMAEKAQSKANAGGSTAQNQLNRISAPASAVSNKLLTNYQSGTLSNADQQSIAQYGQQQQAQIKQYYASAGLSNSSMEMDALSKVSAQQIQMMQQALNNELNGGLSAAGVAQGPQLAGVQAAATADQQSQQAMTNFMQALAKMYSSSGSSNSSS